MKNNKINAKEPVIVLSGHNWHGGVIGIIASRLKEKYNKPTVIISVEKAWDELPQDLFWDLILGKLL